MGHRHIHRKYFSGILLGWALSFSTFAETSAHTTQSNGTRSAKGDCLQSLSNDDRQKIRDFDEAFRKVSSLPKEAQESQVDKLLNEQLPKLSPPVQQAVLAASARMKLFRLYKSLSGNPGLAKAYLELNQAFEDLAMLQEGSGILDNMFGQSKVAKVMDRLKIAFDDFNERVDHAPSFTDEEKTQLKIQMHKAENFHLNLAKAGIDRDLAKEEIGLAVSQVTAMASASIVLSVGGYMVAGALAPAATASMAATGTALTTATAAIGGEAAAGSVLTTSISASVAVLKTAALAATVAGAGTGGIVGLSKTAKLIADAKIEAHFNDDNFFCALARGVEENGPEAVRATLKSAALGAAIGGTIALIPATGATVLVAAGASIPAATATASFFSVATGGVLVVGGLASSLSAVKADSDAIVRHTERAHELLLQNDIEASKKELMLARKSSADAGIDSATAIFNGLLGAKSLTAYKQGLSQAWAQLSPFVRAVKAPVLAPSPNGSISLLTPEEVKSIKTETVLFDHEGNTILTTRHPTASTEMGPYSLTHTKWGIPAPAIPPEKNLIFSPPKNLKFADSAEIPPTAVNGHPTHTLRRITLEQFKTLKKGTVLISTEGERAVVGSSYVDLSPDDFGLIGYGFVKAGTASLPVYTSKTMGQPTYAAVRYGLIARNLPAPEVAEIRRIAQQRYAQSQQTSAQIKADVAKLKAEGKIPEVMKLLQTGVEEGCRGQFYQELTLAIDQPWRFLHDESPLLFLVEGNSMVPHFPRLNAPAVLPSPPASSPPPPSPKKAPMRPVLEPAY